MSRNIHKYKWEQESNQVMVVGWCYIDRIGNNEENNLVRNSLVMGDGIKGRKLTCRHIVESQRNPTKWEEWDWIYKRGHEATRQCIPCKINPNAPQKAPIRTLISSLCNRNKIMKSDRTWGTSDLVWDHCWRLIHALELKELFSKQLLSFHCLCHGSKQIKKNDYGIDDYKRKNTVSISKRNIMESISMSMRRATPGLAFATICIAKFHHNTEPYY